MLIVGIILEQAKINPPHAVACELISDALRSIFGPDWLVRMGTPLDVNRDTDPEPDLYVVRGKPRDFLAAHPSTAFLVVDVSDTTLFFTRLSSWSGMRPRAFRTIGF